MIATKSVKRAFHRVPGIDSKKKIKQAFQESRRVPGILNFQCRRHTRPPHSKGAFAWSLLHIHICSTIVFPRRYREHDLQCIFGYTQSCGATNAVSATHRPTKVKCTKTSISTSFSFQSAFITFTTSINSIISSPNLQICN